MKRKLSIILPTLNEYKNLSFLLPELVEMLEVENFENYEIIVVDDGSTDQTVDFMSKFNKRNAKVKLISRKKNHSLPLSIWEGIENSIYPNVMWLDADGSMHVDAVRSLIIKYFEMKKIIIGSRFVTGGGYKGVKDLNNESFFRAIINVNKSEDSVLGMVLSILFNKFLNVIFNSEVNDLTSGFIIIEKNKLNRKHFENSIYGEYFIEVVTSLIVSNTEIEEIGYVCETRKYGKSKTASSVYQLISRGIPYIKTAYRCRKKLKNANI